MRVLVFAHRLEVGGTQVNAIELAETLRNGHDFDVMLFASPGPMLELVKKKRLKFVAAPDVSLHPSPVRMRALRSAVRQFKPDIIHAWDWWQTLEAYCATYLTMRQPILATDMMMDLTAVMPKQIPTTFGIPALRQQAVGAGWRHADVLLPPVDTFANAPGAVDGNTFRQAFGVGSGEIAIVSVSRLAGNFKSSPISDAISVVRRLGKKLPIKFLIVGDGPARKSLEEAASAANSALGRSAVLFAGPLIDPRPAYEAADIVIGMGGSALRGLAFAKPLVVVGKEGFARLFSPASADKFHDTGMYGGANDLIAGQTMAESLQLLSEDKNTRMMLGKYGRNFVVKHHALTAVTEQLVEKLHNAVNYRPDTSLILHDVIRTGVVYLKERRFMCASQDRRSARSPS